jgi:hypothetical protein
MPFWIFQYRTFSVAGLSEHPESTMSSTATAERKENALVFI